MKLKHMMAATAAALSLTVGTATAAMAAPPDDEGVPTVAEIDRELDGLRKQKKDLETSLASNRNYVETLKWALTLDTPAVTAADARRQLAQYEAYVAEDQAALAEVCAEIAEYEDYRRMSAELAALDAELGALAGEYDVLRSGVRASAEQIEGLIDALADARLSSPLVRPAPPTSPK